LEDQVSSNFEEENHFETERRSAMSIEERLQEFVSVQNRVFFLGGLIGEPNP